MDSCGAARPGTDTIVQTHRERIGENARIFDFALSDRDMAALGALDRTNGTDRALERTCW
jgi:diketogulonate reductase-like aldo/keto reductase